MFVLDPDQNLRMVDVLLRSARQVALQLFAQGTLMLSYGAIVYAGMAVPGAMITNSDSPARAFPVSFWCART